MTRIGIDTGGTFTDLVVLGRDGILVHKVRSTPDDPSRAILEGLDQVVGAPDDAEIVHGSTVATNAVLERKGVRVALVATAGFEDVLRIGRQTRRELYNFQVAERRPIVARGLTFGITERLAADGTVLVPLDPDEVDRLAEQLRTDRVDAVAVCLLHSYRNPVHEQLAAERLEAAGLVVSASHRVLPEYREFERWSTTALNAYVTPLMARYLGALERQLGHTRLRIMQSNGGSISAGAAKAAAVQTILSGPAAGVVGARAVAEATGYPRIISFDMGGTSTDVSLVDGVIGLTTESTVGDYPVRLPVIDIHTVGAGGGSIAFIDSGGALRVGPRSAGADPGPVCYGRGDELTVTDANLLLGRLDPGYFLGGRMALDVDRATAAARAFASHLGLAPTALADGIVRVANANMERAIRVVSVERGFDPREFALVAFGGAGGMHACEIADKLDIATIIVPRHAGVLSALGMLLADVTKDYSLTILQPSDRIDLAELERRFAPLVEHALADLSAEGFEGDRAIVDRSLDVRYIGQSFEITVPCTAGYRAEFDRAHERLYGYANAKRPTEVVTLRVRATGITEKPELPGVAIDQAQPAEPATRTTAWFDGRPVGTALYRWEDLQSGAIGDGPAIVASAQATAVVPPAFRFRIDEFGNVIAVRGAPRPARPKRERAAASTSMA
jgi:N-methylhydantoinase A/oxoprolinase/acetone carboxylase beta subunit